MMILILHDHPVDVCHSYSDHNSISTTYQDTQPIQSSHPPFKLI